MKKIAELYVHAGQQIGEIAAKQPEHLAQACDAFAGRVLNQLLRFVGKRTAANGASA